MLVSLTITNYRTSFKSCISKSLYINAIVYQCIVCCVFSLFLPLTPWGTIVYIIFHCKSLYISVLCDMFSSSFLALMPWKAVEYIISHVILMMICTKSFKLSFIFFTLAERNWKIGFPYFEVSFFSPKILVSIQHFKNTITCPRDI